jgi:hypothetical protein
MKKLATIAMLALGVMTRAAAAQVVGPDGWTQFTPAADSRLVYVSTGGSDSNSGLSPSSPKRTLSAGVGLLRDGYPDWLLLRSGESWNEVFPGWNKGGRSASEPMRVGVYDGAQRATILCGTSQGLQGWYGGLSPKSHLAFTDLAFVANTYDGSNSGSSAFSLLGSWSDVLLENVSISGFPTNLIFQSDRTSEVMRDIKLRRCMLTDSYRTGPEHSLGCFFAGVDGLLLEDCLFDHNGWNESVSGAVANIYRHNIYIQGHNGLPDDCSNVVVRGVISARAAATGIQQRPGGVCEDSLFIDNPMAVVFGNAGGVLRECVVVGSRDIDSSNPRGTAYNLVNGGNMTAERCLAVGGSAMGTANVYGYSIDSATNVALRDCVTWHWKSAAGSGTPIVAVNAPWPTVSGGNMEQGSPSHEVTVEAYMSSLGGVASVDSFMAEARKQSRASWRREFTAGAFNDWARGAFGMGGATPCYANCDGSVAAPVLNVADFTCFLQRFEAGDAWANCDGSASTPALNVQDFSCFLQKFAAGCQ